MSTAKSHGQRPSRQRNRREKSGVPALDQDFSDANEEDDVRTEREEDDEWDFIEADGEERNGARGTSLFARGVVDRYRLAVFRKGATPNRPTATQTTLHALPPPPLPSRTARVLPARLPKSVAAAQARYPSADARPSCAQNRRGRRGWRQCLPYRPHRARARRLANHRSSRKSRSSRLAALALRATHLRAGQCRIRIS